MKMHNRAAEKRSSAPFRFKRPLNMSTKCDDRDECFHLHGVCILNGATRTHEERNSVNLGYYHINNMTNSRHPLMQNSKQEQILQAGSRAGSKTQAFGVGLVTCSKHEKLHPASPDLNARAWICNHMALPYAVATDAFDTTAVRINRLLLILSL